MPSNKITTIISWFVMPAFLKLGKFFKIPSIVLSKYYLDSLYTVIQIITFGLKFFKTEITPSASF